MVFVTGDCHGRFERLEEFCWERGTTREDILVILGDAGFNYYLDDRDREKKEMAAELPITLLCVHGNHEERPSELDTYEPMRWMGGAVWVERAYPNLLFAEDGHIFRLEGRRALVLGGAYSVDKPFRLLSGEPWFPTEQMDEEARAYAERALDKAGWQVDYVFSHTAPLGYEPRDVFVPYVDQGTVDKTTEEWLGRIEKWLDYRRWYAGHFHITRRTGKVWILYEDYLRLGE